VQKKREKNVNDLDHIGDSIQTNSI